MTKQVSDIVSPSTIRAATERCERDDCCLSAEVMETNTGGTSRHYTKTGELVVTDYNRRTTRVGCRRCWTYVDVFQTGDTIHAVVDVTEREKQRFAQRTGNDAAFVYAPYIPQVNNARS